jgi:glucose-6-phosphate 1-dehydrogenase
MSVLQSPSVQSSRGERIPEPCVMVIFGASGDLTKRKLMPALFKLFQNGLLPTGFSVIGIARAQETHDSFRENMKNAVQTFSEQSPNMQVWEDFARGLFYLSGDADDQNCYVELLKLLETLDSERKTLGNRLFYLAVSPVLYPIIIEHLGQSKLSHPKSNKNWTRIIIEKPFGRDLASAKELNEKINLYFAEDQVYRIDHFLGKETVQNILVFRFANSIFEPIWSNHYIDHVQITVAESIGIENRGSYYDNAGALRDMVQNHMLQLVCTVAMEPPASFTATAVRDEKSKLMQAIRPIRPFEVSNYTVRAQYTDGLIDGKPVVGYRKEKNVAPNSRTETYVALQMFIDNWRWADVPFYLRTGKRLPKRASEIVIQFKRTPHLVFARTPEDQIDPNLLILGIQPDESISLRFEAKFPGPAIRLRPVVMTFQYSSSFGVPIEEAYERLLLDALLGDATLFARGDWIELAWSFITPILEGWQADQNSPIPTYPAGTWGPTEADILLAEGKRKWHKP